MDLMTILPVDFTIFINSSLRTSKKLLKKLKYMSNKFPAKYDLLLESNSTC